MDRNTFWLGVFRKIKEKPTFRKVNVSFDTVLKKIEELRFKHPWGKLQEFLKLEEAFYRTIASLWYDADTKVSIAYYSLKVFETYIQHQTQLHYCRKFRVVHPVYLKLACSVYFHIPGAGGIFPSYFPAKFVNETSYDGGAEALTERYLEVGITDAPYPLSEWVKMKPPAWTYGIRVVDWLPKVVLFYSHQFNLLALCFLERDRVVRHFLPAHILYPLAAEDVHQLKDVGAYIQEVAKHINSERVNVAVERGLKIYRRVGEPCREGKQLLAVRDVNSLSLFNTPKGLLRRGIVLQTW